MRRLTKSAGEGCVVDAASADLLWRSMIPICHRCAAMAFTSRATRNGISEHAIWRRVDAIALHRGYELDDDIKRTRQGACGIWAHAFGLNVQSMEFADCHL